MANQAGKSELLQTGKKNMTSPTPPKFQLLDMC
jgi:hypothetical protein